MAIEVVSITPGTGKDIAVETIAGKEFPISKIALGAEDAYDMMLDSGQQTMANSLPVVIASDQSAVPISGALTDTQLRATAVPVSGTVTSTLPANSGVDIGDVTINNGSGAGAVNVQDGGNSLTVDNGGTFAVQDSEKVADNGGFTDGTTKVQPVGFIFDEVAGTALTENDIAAGRLDSKRAQVLVIEDETTRGRRTTVTAANALKVDGSAVTQPVSGTITASNTAGDIAHDNGDSGNPVKIGGKAANAFPTAVANNDRANLITDLFGRLMVTHIDPAQQVWKQIEATSAQTGTAIWTPTAGKRVVVTSMEITTGGTTAGVATVWFGASGDTTFSQGTDQVVFRGEFAPSTTSRPGAILSFFVPRYAVTADHVLRLTTTTAMTIYVTVYGYEI